jgi:hypothetical protein
MADRRPPTNEIIPNPDPSAITSTAIDRAVANAVQITNAKLTAINVRIDGMEKAVEVFQADLTRVPTQLDRAIGGLRELLEAKLSSSGADRQLLHQELNQMPFLIKETMSRMEGLMLEKFAGVEAKFVERDTRTDQRAGDTKLAVDAAFAAAKEATAKIESGFTKSIDSILELIRTTTKASDDKTSDLKDRLTAMEARTAGISAANIDQRGARQDAHNQQVDSHGSTAIIISVIAVIVSIVISIALHFVK